MNITLVPYGNAYEKKNGSEWVFDCQHGPQECRGNVIETCAIFYQKKVQSYFPFIHCMEISDELPDESAKKCSATFPVDFNNIMTCANGTLGNSLEHQMALQTNALQPEQEYVPWVTVNGVHTEKIQDRAEKDLISLICDTYQGVKPTGCQKAEAEGRCRRN